CSSLRCFVTYPHFCQMGAPILYSDGALILPACKRSSAKMPSFTRGHMATALNVTCKTLPGWEVTPVWSLDRVLILKLCPPLEPMPAISIIGLQNCAPLLCMALLRHTTPPDRPSRHFTAVITWPQI